MTPGSGPPPGSRISLFIACLAASMAAAAQPALLSQASDIDWVDWEDLSPEQQATIPDHCCGKYVAPPLAPIEGAAGSVKLSATRYDSDQTHLNLEGDVEIRQNDIQLNSDSGTYNYDTQGAVLTGNIRIRQPGMLLTGTDADVENAGAGGSITNASYVLHDEYIRGTADVITYTDAEGIITIDNGRYTRCEPGNNSWAVEGDNIVLNREKGRGVARRVKLRLGKVPVLYLPVISFPINDERATGFLSPLIGSTRDGGFDLSAPFYLNLAPNYDATITPRIMTNRGVMLGLEGRYRGRRSQNVLQMNYLPQDNLYDPALAQSPGSDSPPVEKRWLISYDHLSRLGAGWRANINYAGVSDREYFQDLGNTGLYSTTRSFLYRSGQMSWQNNNWSLKAGAFGYQIIDPTVPENRQPYDRLPKIDLNGYFFSPLGFEYGLGSEYVRFDRDLNPSALTAAQINRGALVTGERLSIEPEISFPWASPGAFITPKAKYKYATYKLDDPGNVFTEDPSRGVFTGSLDSGLVFERDLKFDDGTLTQTLEPRLFYLYSEYEDQSDIPVFDSSTMTFSFNQLFREDRFSGKDRVGDADQLTLALTTRFLDHLGEEKASASIGQIRYFKDRRVTLNNVPGEAERGESSALATELAWQFHDNWRVNSYLEWNSDSSSLDAGNFQFRYQSDINHILNLSFRYRDVPNPITASGLDRRIKQTDISAVWPLKDNWGLIGRWNYDHANGRNLETIAGFEYNNCCYSVRIIARQWIDNDALFYGLVDDNTGIFLQFELKGFGSVLGGNVSGILNNGISGYREREYAR